MPGKRSNSMTRSRCTSKSSGNGGVTCSLTSSKLGIAGLIVRLKRERRPMLLSLAEAARPKLDNMVVAERTHLSRGLENVRRVGCLIDPPTG